MTEVFLPVIPHDIHQRGGQAVSVDSQIAGYLEIFSRDRQGHAETPIAGYSLMLQKKDTEFCELACAKAGILEGNLSLIFNSPK